MADALTLLVDRIASPIGETLVVGDREGRLHAIHWTDDEARFQSWAPRYFGRDVTLADARDPGGLSSALDRYFAGELGAIEGLPLAFRGTTFQRAVWQALTAIPCGTTVSYGELARRIGKPAAVRAVGLANGANPIPIVVPCHRVIGANGMLTGYGGGLPRKRWLLAHESARATQPSLAL